MPLPRRLVGSKGLTVDLSPLPLCPLCSLHIGLVEEDFKIDGQHSIDDVATDISSSPNPHPLDKKARRFLGFSDAIHEACDHLISAFGMYLPELLLSTKEHTSLSTDQMETPTKLGDELCKAIIGNVVDPPSQLDSKDGLEDPISLGF
ncbi:unnamed protein product [Linum trigynum]|uniref:Uncharacterized protein n=1 Tax=Linum trigynum TaxID=586398 RepID=A0AAV2F625_9ROSI